MLPRVKNVALVIFYLFYNTLRVSKLGLQGLNPLPYSEQIVFKLDIYAIIKIIFLMNSLFILYWHILGIYKTASKL